MPTLINKKKIYETLSRVPNPSYMKLSNEFRKRRDLFDRLNGRIGEIGNDVLAKIVRVERGFEIVDVGMSLELVGQKTAQWEKTERLVMGRINSEFQNERSKMLLSTDFFCMSSMDAEYHALQLDAHLEEFKSFFVADGRPGLAFTEMGALMEVLEASFELNRFCVAMDKVILHTIIASLALGIELPRNFRNWLARESPGGARYEGYGDDFKEYIDNLRGAGEERIAKELFIMLYPKRWEKLFAECTRAEFSQPVPAAAAINWNELPKGAQEEDGGGSEKTRAAIVGKMREYAKKESGEADANYLEWDKLMPGDFSPGKRIPLCAVLAVSAPAPGGREGISGVLEEYGDAILEIIADGPPEAGEAISAYSEVFEYAERFGRDGDLQKTAQAEHGEEAGPGREKVELKRPHESLEFPAQVSQEIGEAGISEENMKRVLVYGLRLSSRKAAIGGKYFVLPLFRKNAERVVESDLLRPREVVGEIEDFLYKHGVIAYYKGDNVIMLNLKEELGRHNKPDETGQAILDSVVKWKTEFDRGQAPGKGGQNGNGKKNGG
jgi:hypothetical protein